jgi:hypothetical protein
MSKRELATEIEIDASPEKVWKMLTDFEGMADWNPYIVSISGNLTPGERLRVRLKQPNRKAFDIKPRLLTVSPGRELRWLGKLGIPGVFDGEHIFEIYPIGDRGVRFVQRERFSGFLVPLLWNMLDTDTRDGFEQMNLALKQTAETAT